MSNERKPIETRIFTSIMRADSPITAQQIAKQLDEQVTVIQNGLVQLYIRQTIQPLEYKQGASTKWRIAEAKT